VADKYLVFVPLQEEMKYAYQYMIMQGATTLLPYDPAHDSYHFLYTRPNRTPGEVTFVVLGDMGNTFALGRIAPYLADIRPHASFLVGLAGSIDPNVNLGDVIVSSRSKAIFPDKIKTLNPNKEEVADRANITIPHPNGAKVWVDSRKVVFGGGSFLRYRRATARSRRSEMLLARYAAYLQRSARLALDAVSVADIPALDPNLENAAPQIHEGTILGSDMVIDSQDYLAFVQERDKDSLADVYNQRGMHARQQWFPLTLLAVDMESFGFLQLAAQERQFTDLYLTVRGISDLAAGKEDLDASTAHQVRDIAVQNAVKVAIDLLNYVIDNKVGGP
jgi:nucleoside phosphorylase